MSESRPILTVSVPTWNRSASLARTLDSVLDQLGANGPRSVELLVSDNASDDETPAVVSRAAARAPGTVASFRNDHNVGGIQNALLTLERASGEFWMFYGDDDIVPDGALAPIVYVLSENPDAAVFVFGDPLGGGYFGSLDGPTPLTLEEAAEKLFYDIGNAGRFAVRRDLAAAALAEHGRDFFRTSWPQTELAFLAAAQVRGSSFLAVPLASSESVGHEENTLYTTYYLLRTAVVDLDRSAHDLAALVGDAFHTAARRHVFSSSRMKDMLRGSVVLVAFGSTASDRGDSRVLLRDALRCADGVSAKWYLLLLAVLMTPPWLMKVLLAVVFSLKDGIPTARVRMRQLANDAQRAERERVEGSRRAYGPGEL